MLVQIAWYGSEKVTQLGRENGSLSVVDQSSVEAGTQLMSAVNDSNSSSDDELFGLLDKSGASKKVTSVRVGVSVSR